MVALDDYPGITVEIIVGGQALTEYLDPDPSDTNVTRYVEATSGACFEVKVTAAGDYQYFRSLLNSNAMSFLTEVDGAPVKSVIAAENDFRGCNPWSTLIDGKKIQSGGTWTKRRLMFSNIALGNYSLDVPLRKMLCLAWRPDWRCRRGAGGGSQKYNPRSSRKPGSDSRELLSERHSRTRRVCTSGWPG
jgi:hypothetical protein